MPLRSTVLLAVLALGCGKDEARPSAPAAGDTDEEPQTDPKGTEVAGEQPAVVLGSGPSEVRVVVEVARTPRQIQRGMMYRTHLPPDAGMLFLMRRETVQSFWMKNTLIPLDLIFITGDMVVAGVVENAEPKTTTSRAIDRPSRYVLEVNGGWAAAHGVEPGTPVRFENVEPRAP